jgi:glucose-6-phosphate isomerase
MLEAAAAYAALGLDFAKHAVAITGPGSELDKHTPSPKAGWRAFRCGTGWAAARV